MGLNAITKSPDPLAALGEVAANGAKKYGAIINLAQNTEVKIRIDLEDFAGKKGDPNDPNNPPLPGKQALWNTAKAAKAAATKARIAVETDAITFCAETVDFLKKPLGRQWNSAWEAAGFSGGSLAMPSDPVPMFDAMHGYFLANPGNENAQAGATAAACMAQKIAVVAARTASNQSNVDAGIAKTAREASQEALYQRLSGLLAELGQLLASDDPRWYAFGFVRPDDGQQAGLVLHLVLTAGAVGSGMVFADWDDSPRANSYRVMKQIAGTDAKPVQVGLPSESEFTLTGLPPGAAVTVTVIAVNDAGDSPASDPAKIVVP